MKSKQKHTLEQRLDLHSSTSKISQKEKDLINFGLDDATLKPLRYKILPSSKKLTVQIDFKLKTE